MSRVEGSGNQKLLHLVEVLGKVRGAAWKRKEEH
jgi:hypothetical protein